jgi:hypothetical protein
VTITSNRDLAAEQYIPKMKLGIKFPLPQIISFVNANHWGSNKKLAVLPQQVGRVLWVIESCRAGSKLLF